MNPHPGKKGRVIWAQFAMISPSYWPDPGTLASLAKPHVSVLYRIKEKNVHHWCQYWRTPLAREGPSEPYFVTRNGGAPGPGQHTGASRYLSPGPHGVMSHWAQNVDVEGQIIENWIIIQAGLILGNFLYCYIYNLSISSFHFKAWPLHYNFTPSLV